jgi:hypothetical protein
VNKVRSKQRATGFVNLKTNFTNLLDVGYRETFTKPRMFCDKTAEIINQCLGPCHGSGG